jgi:hypothetical protein
VNRIFLTQPTNNPPNNKNTKTLHGYFCLLACLTWKNFTIFAFSGFLWFIVNDPHEYCRILWRLAFCILKFCFIYRFSRMNLISHISLVDVVKMSWNIYHHEPWFYSCDFKKLPFLIFPAGLRNRNPWTLQSFYSPLTWLDYDYFWTLNLLILNAPELGTSSEFY